MVCDRVRTGPRNPGKSMNLKRKNPGLESPWNFLKVLESPGILNSEKRDCKNDVLLESNTIFWYRKPGLFCHPIYIFLSL